MGITFPPAALLLLGLHARCLAYPQQHPLPDVEDAEFIGDCVRAHNAFRSRVNPPASNMLRVSWDAALAKAAKAWAKRCMFRHNIYLKIPGKVHPTFTSAGENIWTGTATTFSVDRALGRWFDEVSSYDFHTNACTGVCGHYTQVVWATSYKVGCAVHFCPRVMYSSITNAAHFICNYGPAGNYPTRPYKAGQPCSACRNEKCTGNLCDWDTQPQPPQPHPPKRPVPPHIPPEEHPHRSCDQYCLSICVLRPLLLLLSTGAVLLVQQQFPHRFFY
ncbi:GLIP1 protein, partial [Rhinopomastus cyanomelas]|nr:GLIP1 protein [Rhinopomastus cyanomelas]